jgi:hypothetical protein
MPRVSVLWSELEPVALHADLAMLALAPLNT